MIKVHDLIRYAENAVGGGYCWGADGQTCTPALRQELADRTSNSAAKENLLTVCAKWDGKKVWDCSGLFRGAWRTLLKYRSGGATGIYENWCAAKGPITTMPDEPGIALFRGDSRTKEHIGLYIGNGEVIDARSSGKGVVRGQKAAYKWTHWGRLADVDYSEMEDKPTVLEVKWRGTVKTKTGNGINLWDTPLKTVSVQRVPEGETVNVLDDAHGGLLLASYGGRLGYADVGYLVPEGSAMGDPDANQDRIMQLETRVSALEKILGVEACDACQIEG